MRLDLSPAAIRSGRISELTRMALKGKTLKQIKTRAFQMASKKIALEYVEEVQRRVKK